MYLLFPPALLFLSVFFGAVGQLLLKIGATQLYPLTLTLPQLSGTLSRTFSNPWVLAGTFMYAASMITWLKVLSTMELSLAYPMVSLGYVLVMVLSVLFLGEHLTFYKIAGVAAVITGVLLIGHH